MISNRKNVQPYLSLGSALFIVTLTDLIIVEGVFRPLQAWNLIWRWHLVFFLMFLTFTALLGLAYRKLILFSALTGIYLFLGIEDTLYYLLRDLSLPAKYLGITLLGVYEPSTLQVLAMNIVGGALIILCLTLNNKRKEKNLC
jgi:hypothetical protein